MTPTLTILHWLARRTHATVSANAAACAMTPGEVRGCLVALVKKRDAAAMRSALEAVGVEFISEDGGGDGVRLRNVRPSSDGA